MASLAARASSRTAETSPFLEDVSAREALEGRDDELSFLRQQRTGKVRQVLVDLLFPNADGLGEFLGVHLLRTEKGNHLLPNCLRTLPVRVLLHLTLIRKDPALPFEIEGLITDEPLSLSCASIPDQYFFTF